MFVSAVGEGLRWGHEGAHRRLQDSSPLGPGAGSLVPTAAPQSAVHVNIHARGLDATEVNQNEDARRARLMEGRCLVHMPWVRQREPLLLVLVGVTVHSSLPSLPGGRTA